MTLHPPQPLKAPASASRPRRRRAAGRPVTRTEELRLQIADDIVRGRLAPGTPLEEVEIAKRYGVSRTPVREALRGNAAERAGLEATHAELADLTRRGDEGGYTVLNERFHTTLYAGSHNDYLAELTLATRARLQPFRRAQFRTLGRLARSYEEHDRVVTAILRGDKAEAAAAMRAHILTVEVAYERYAESV